MLLLMDTIRLCRDRPRARLIMRPRRLSFFIALFVIAWGQLLVRPCLAQGGQGPVTSNQQQRAVYEEALAAYQKARNAFNTDTAKYWESIRAQRVVRRNKRSAGDAVVAIDYVPGQPPDYAGPAAPKMPAFMLAEQTKTGGSLQQATNLEPTPAVRDFLAAAKAQYRFVPRSTSEKDYMLAFARKALSAGLTAEQVVGVYSLETGGLGPYSRQSGVFSVDNQCRPVAAHGKPASSLALGYVQLLPANTISTARDHADAIAGHLTKLAERAPKGKAAELRNKAAILKRMVSDALKWVRTYAGPKDDWQEYVAYGHTKNGLAMHALLLDADIGPSLQVYKLLGIKKFAARQGLVELNSAQLELINLVGDGRGVDALAPAAKDAPAANFFDRNGYEGNPVAKDRTAGSLLAKLGDIIARHKLECGSKRFFEAFEAANRERLKRGPAQT
jgi:hypothetical protein